MLISQYQIAYNVLSSPLSYVPNYLITLSQATCFKSGKTTCGCSYYLRNSICCHSVAIASHNERLPGLLKNFPGRNLNNVATTSAPKNVGLKKPTRPSKKRRLEPPSVETLLPASATADNEPSTNFSVRNINSTNLVISRNIKPPDPSTSSPLVVKSNLKSNYIILVLSVWNFSFLNILYSFLHSFHNRFSIVNVKYHSITGKITSYSLSWLLATHLIFSIKCSYECGIR